MRDHRVRRTIIETHQIGSAGGTHSREGGAVNASILRLPPSKIVFGRLLGLARIAGSHGQGAGIYLDERRFEPLLSARVPALDDPIDAIPFPIQYVFDAELGIHAA
jgi:hypothetical protein